MLDDEIPEAWWRPGEEMLGVPLPRTANAITGEDPAALSGLIEELSRAPGQLGGTGHAVRTVTEAFGVRVHPRAPAAVFPNATRLLRCAEPAR